MTVAATVARFANATLDVSRPGATSVVAGRAVAGTSTGFTTRAVVQPATARDLARLPEGRLVTEVVAVWTSDALLVGDLLTTEGTAYEVEAVLARARDGAFHKALARRVPA